MTITDQEAVLLLNAMRMWKSTPQGCQAALTRAIEVLEARGEPVAWLVRDWYYEDWDVRLGPPEANWLWRQREPLYAAPPAPTVTVTDEMASTLVACLTTTARGQWLPVSVADAKLALRAVLGPPNG